MQHLQAANVVKAKVFRYSQNLLNWSGTLVWRQATIPNKKFCYSPLAVFIALMLVGPSNFLKQIQIKSNINGIRIPTGRRRTSWLFTSVVGELNSELPWTNPANTQAGLELGPFELQVQRSNHSARLPPRGFQTQRRQRLQARWRYLLVPRFTCLCDSQFKPAGFSGVGFMSVHHRLRNSSL